MSRRLGGLLTNSAPSPNMETMAADFAASKFAPNGYSSRQAAAAAAQENVAQDRQGGPGPPAGPRLGRALSSPSPPQGPTSDHYLALAHAIHQGALAFSVSSMDSTATACLWGAALITLLPASCGDPEKCKEVRSSTAAADPLRRRAPQVALTRTLPGCSFQRRPAALLVEHLCSLCTAGAVGQPSRSDSAVAAARDAAVKLAVFQHQHQQEQQQQQMLQVAPPPPVPPRTIRFAEVQQIAAHRPLHPTAPGSLRSSACHVWPRYVAGRARP